MSSPDERRLVSSALADLREVPLTKMAALTDESVGESLRRILPKTAVASPRLPLFNSAI
jgi:FXSXX-COOH protein